MTQPHPDPTPPAPPAPAPPPPTPPAPPAPPPPPPQPQPPVPTPQFVAPVPTPPQPPATGGPGQPPAQAPATGTTDPAGFPANTPWREMQPVEQVAYWQHLARKHEDRVRSMGDYDQLKEQADSYQRLVTASQTEHERAVAEARRQARTEALTEAGSQLVEQWVRAAAVGRLPQESVDVLLLNLDRPRFLTSTGEVDTDKVFTFVGSLAPAPAPAAGTPGQQPPAGQPPVPAPTPIAAPPRGTDFGQGAPGTANATGIAAGREIARQRFAKTPTAPA